MRNRTIGRLRAGGSGFAPWWLFANGEAGVNFESYDPLRYGGPVTMWQDIARTTPITAVEQAIASIRDTARANSTIYLEQSTSGARPVLTARVNLLQKTEDFTDAVWAKTNGGTGTVPAVTGNFADGPFAGTRASRVQFALNGGTTVADFSRLNQSVAGSAGPVLRPGVWIRSNTGANVVVSLNVTANTPTTITVTPAWQFLTPAQVAMTPVIWDYRLELRGSFATADSADVLIYAADMRTAADASLNIPAYQRVNTSTDYDTAGFPHRIKGDALDDFGSCALNLSATDKMTAWMGGLLKVSDATTAMLFELTANSATTAGGIALIAPPSAAAASYGFRSNGNPAGVSPVTTLTNYAAPRNDVVICDGDIAGDVMGIQANSDARVTSSADQGTGNYANSTLYVGARAGTSLYSGAGWTSLTILGRTATSTERAQMARYAANLAKIP